jgi:beta-lactamase class A
MFRQSKVTVRVLSVACAILLVGNIGWFVKGDSSNDKNLVAANEQRNYPLLAKRIFTDDSNDIIINFVPLRKSLQSRFAELKVQKSFYFEYLPDGTSIRNGADQQLVAASLIKVPLVMNLYKAAELRRVDLDKVVTITQSELDNAYGNLWQKGAGTTITLREAARYALEQSDNTATHVIFDNTKDSLRDDEQSLSRLDVDQDMQNGQAVINARSYASVLKSLYFSSYLQKADSQTVLDMLSKSVATNRLTRDLPKGVPVAHKIGVYNTSWAESDCGIVYAPKRPYLICVMVGLPEQQANDFIASISKEVYEYVTRQ